MGSGSLRYFATGTVALFLNELEDWPEATGLRARDGQARRRRDARR
jgi:hypothetical protein